MRICVMRFSSVSAVQNNKNQVILFLFYRMFDPIFLAVLLVDQKR